MSDLMEPQGARTLLTRKLKDASGAAIALVALCMVALLSAVALAVDVGMLVTARTEAQLLADAAAHAGARQLRDTGGNVDEARAEAILAGTENTVRGENVTILPEDVDVIPDEWTVRVRVNRTAARNNPVPTYFARIFGVNAVDIRTDAAAWAAPSMSAGAEEDAHCLLPLALVDYFEDANDNGVYDEGVDGYDPDNDIGGYDASHHGKLIKLKIHNNDPNTGPPACRTDDGNPDVWNNIDYCQDGGDSSSWRCWWRESEPGDGGGGGTDVLGPRIYPADDCGPAMEVGDPVYAASGSGNKQSLVHDQDGTSENNFETLIRSEEDLLWCESCAGGNGCVAHQDDPDSCANPRDFARIRTAPIVDPRISESGSHTTSTVVDFMGVFVEQVSCAYDAGPYALTDGGRWNVYVRLMITGGSGGGSNPDDDAGESLVQDIQLIE